MLSDQLEQPTVEQPAEQPAIEPPESLLKRVLKGTYVAVANTLPATSTSRRSGSITARPTTWVGSQGRSDRLRVVG